MGKSLQDEMQGPVRLILIPTKKILQVVTPATSLTDIVTTSPMNFRGVSIE